VTSMPRQRLRPGISGISRRPIDPAEAYRIENLVMQRDGVWMPRRAFTSAGLTGVSHVSNLKRDHLMIIQSGALKVWQESGVVATIDTGWPSASSGLNAGWIQYTRAGLGATGPRQPVWCAPKKSRFGYSPASMYYASAQTIGTGGVLTGGRSTLWMENHSLHTIGGQGNSIFFSDAADVASWGLNDIDLPWRIGELKSIISLDDLQVMLFGDQGVGSLQGNTLGNFSIGLVHNDLVLPYGGVTAVRCGRRVMVIGPGPSVYEVGMGGVRRISNPIESSRTSGGLTWELTDRDITSLNAWYDSTTDEYWLSSNSAPSMTWVYDLERNRWTRTIPRHMVGLGLIRFEGSGADRKYYAVDGTLAYSHDFGTPTTFSDLNEPQPVWCVIETAPEHHQMPEAEQQSTALYLDATGSWTVTLRHRDGPDQDWKEEPCGAYTAPCWIHLPQVVYRERSFRFAAAAASDTRFRGVELDERVVAVV